MEENREKGFEKMKKRWKVFWIVCAILIVLGCIMCGTGLILGVDMHYFEKRGIEHNESGKEKTSKIIPGENIKRIDLDIPIGRVEVKGYNGNQIRWNFENMEHGWSYEMEREEETLSIEVEKESLFGRHIWGWNSIGDMTLYIPNSMLLDRVYINMGIGEVYLEGVNAIDTSVECGIGDVEYIANGLEEDYDTDCSVGIGKIKVGGATYEGFGVDPSTSKQAPKNIKMDCRIGDLKIQFK